MSLPAPRNEEAAVDLLALAEADIATASAALADLAAFLAQGARPWFEADGKPVREEQTILHRTGTITVELAAARASLAKAREGNWVAAIAEARLLAAEAAKSASRFLFEAGGTSTTDDQRDFARHWRATLASAEKQPLREARLAAGRHALARSRPDFAVVADFHGSPADVEDAYRRADVVAALLLQGAAQRDRDRTPPVEALARLAASGLLAITVPPRFGGAGLDYADALEVCRRVSYGDSSVGQILTIHYGMLEALQRTGTETQLARWLPKAANGARFGNAAAERGVEHAKVTATRLTAYSDGRYRLSGRKFYSTGATGADFITVLAIADDGQPASAIVAAGSAGLQVLDDWAGLGQRGTGSGTTILDDVIVSSEQVLPRWLNADAPSLGNAAANLAHVGIDLGIARGALDDIVDLLRRQGVAGDDVLAFLGDLSARLHASEALFATALEHLRKLGAVELAIPTVQQFSLEVSIVKVHAGELAIDIGAALLELGGDTAFGHDRHWRNARTHTLHDPSRWRYLRIGDHALNGRLPPRNRTN